MRIRTSQGTFSIAIKTSKKFQDTKRHFALATTQGDFLINKNSFIKRTKCSKIFLNDILNSPTPRSLEILLDKQQSLSSLSVALLDAAGSASSSACHKTALQINSFIQENISAWSCWINDNKTIVTSMPDGRKMIVHKDRESDLHIYIDLCPTPQAATSIGKGKFKTVYPFYNWDKQKPNIAVSVQEITDHTALLSAENEEEIIKMCKDIPQVLGIKCSARPENIEVEPALFISVMKRYENNWLSLLSSASLEDNLAAFTQVIKGVALLHQKKIIHRDLKFENILYRHKKNGKLEFKIADFGLSCKATEKKVLMQRSGTYPYMAPEVLGYLEKDPYKIDVWSLGVMLYRIYYDKRVPYYQPLTDLVNNLKKQEEGLDLSKRHEIRKMNKKHIYNFLLKEVTSLREGLLQSSDPWSELIAGMLNPNPRKRYSIAQCLEMLESLTLQVMSN
ncbi:MAG: protein kinase domain-containing protein [Parachlamydiaceae bacterium]